MMSTRLNPDPTDVQLALFHRHKKAGTTPGNPKWYERERVKITPFEFKAGQPPKYPRLPSGADWNTAHSQFSATKRRPVVTVYKDGSKSERYRRGK